MGRTAEETARNLSSWIGGRTFLWMLESLDEDHELERFFSGIPGFCNSKVVDDPLGTYIRPNAEKVSEALIGLVHHTLSSSLIPKTVKQERIVICREAVDVISLLISPQIMRRVLYKEWEGLLNCVEFGLFLRRANHADPLTAHWSRCMVAVILTTVQEHDDLWFELAIGHLGVSRADLRNYLAHGDSMLLANCIHTIRFWVSDYSMHHWVRPADLQSKTLESVSKFEVRQTLPPLQHAFCLMWNKVVLLARGTRSRDAHFLWVLILRHMRNIYIGLHQGTNAVPTAFSASTCIEDSILGASSSYPLCNIKSHHPVRPATCLLTGQHDAAPDTLPSANLDLGNIHPANPQSSSGLPATPSDFELAVLQSLTTIPTPFYVYEPDLYGLRNEIALRARSGGSYHSRLDSINTFRNIRHIYIALHRDIEAAPATIPIFTADSDLIPLFHPPHPLLNMADPCQCLGPPSHFHEVAIGIIGETADGPGTFSSAVLSHDAVLNTATPPAKPGVPSTSAQNPNHASTHSAEALLHSDIPVASQHLVLMTTFSPPATPATRISPINIEGHHLCTTSLDSAIVGATQGVPHILAISSEPVLRTYPIRAFFEFRSILPRPPLAASSSHGDFLAPKQNEDPTIPLPTFLVHCVCVCQLRPSATHSPQTHL
ncbi:hypothetical protein BJV78DRAFT_1220226 [Lactifluus subvellereus]|nr:hypothetical protein BJV78DRAFT_1220226 [Lactifluus subvellereus]